VPLADPLFEDSPSCPCVTDWPRFIADAMLGSLAKWLRIIGFDTLYCRTFDDNEIARIGKQQQRTVLTRDTALARKKTHHSVILIRSQDTFTQVKEVLTAVARVQGKAPSATPGAAGDEVCLPSHPRCPRCNGQLLRVDKETLLNEVPEHVFLTSQSFLRCEACAKVFWEGSHKRMIDKALKEITREIAARWKSSGSD
jgi:hypothetical protein